MEIQLIMRKKTDKQDEAFEFVKAIQSKDRKTAKQKLENLLKLKVAKRIKETLDS